MSAFPPLETGTTICDVLGGKGGDDFSFHPGNMYYHGLIEAYYVKYDTSRNKTEISAIIVWEITHVARGRFLTRKKKDCPWVELTGEDQQIEKVKNAFRSYRKKLEREMGKHLDAYSNGDQMAKADIVRNVVNTVFSNTKVPLEHNLMHVRKKFDEKSTSKKVMPPPTNPPRTNTAPKNKASRNVPAKGELFGEEMGLKPVAVTSNYCNEDDHYKESGTVGMMSLSSEMNTISVPSRFSMDTTDDTSEVMREFVQQLTIDGESNSDVHSTGMSTLTHSTTRERNSRGNAGKENKSIFSS